MAVTASGVQLTTAHREIQLRISRALATNVLGAWNLIDLADIDGSAESWQLVTLQLMRQARAQSAEVAERYMSAFRAVELPGVRPIVIEPMSELRTAAAAVSLRVSGPVALKGAIARGVKPSRALDIARVRVVAESQRHALEGARDTISAAVERDDRALGFQRRTSGSPCSFCALIASRGPVYKSERSAGFQAHGGCGCQPEPVYSDETEWTPGARQYRELWDEVSPGRSNDEAQLEFRRRIEGRSKTAE